MSREENVNANTPMSVDFAQTVFRLAPPRLLGWKCTQDKSQTWRHCPRMRARASPGDNGFPGTQLLPRHPAYRARTTSFAPADAGRVLGLSPCASFVSSPPGDITLHILSLDFSGGCLFSSSQHRGSLCNEALLRYSHAPQGRKGSRRSCSLQRGTLPSSRDQRGAPRGHPSVSAGGRCPGGRRTPSLPTAHPAYCRAASLTAGKPSPELPGPALGPPCTAWGARL